MIKQVYVNKTMTSYFAPTWSISCASFKVSSDQSSDWQVSAIKVDSKGQMCVDVTIPDFALPGQYIVAVEGESYRMFGNWLYTGVFQVE